MPLSPKLLCLTCNPVSFLAPILMHAALACKYWFSPAHLLSFSQRKHEKVTAGREAIGSNRASKLASFESAVKVGSYSEIHFACQKPFPIGMLACSTTLYIVAGTVACHGSRELNQAL